MQAHQLPLNLKSMPALGREDFFVTPCNAFAVHWIEEWPKGWAPFPCLNIYGSKGSGKSHLTEVWRQKSSAVILSAEDFIKISVTDIFAMSKNIVIDRVDLLIGDRAQEEKFFHLYNGFQQNHMFMLLLSRLSPEKMEFEIKDVASRLRASPNAEILAPDDELLFKVLARRFHDQGYVVTDQAILFAVTRMERSWEALDHLIEAAITEATSQKKPITLPLLRDVMVRLNNDI